MPKVFDDGSPKSLGAADNSQWLEVGPTEPAARARSFCVRRRAGNIPTLPFDGPGLV